MSFNRAVVIFCIAVMAFGGIKNVEAKVFTDVKVNDWAYQAISKLSDEGVLNGYSDGRFLPDKLITRAELATMLVKVLDLQTMPIAQFYEFKDVSKNNSAYYDVQKVASLNLIKGTTETLFEPNSYINKAQLAVILSKMASVQPLDAKEAFRVLNVYYDSDEVPSWAKIAVAKAVKGGLIINYPQAGFLKPSKEVTRAEVAVMLHNLSLKIKREQNLKQNSNLFKFNEGSLLNLELLTPLSISNTQKGDIVILAFKNNVVSGENIIIPKGSRVEGVVKQIVLSEFQCYKVSVDVHSLLLPSGKVFPVTAYFSKDIKVPNANSVKREKTLEYIIKKNEFKDEGFKKQNLIVKSGELIQVKLQKAIVINLNTGEVL